MLNTKPAKIVGGCDVGKDIGVREVVEVYSIEIARCCDVGECIVIGSKKQDSAVLA